jgi:hypothetical protein
VSLPCVNVPAAAGFAISIESMDMARRDFQKHVVRALTISFVLGVAPTLYADDASTAERLRQLENTVANLQQQLRRYEAKERRTDEQNERILRAQMEAILGDIDLKQDTAGHGYGGGYGEGLDVTVWGWLTYLTMSNSDRNTFWAWEIEIDVTKTFTERLAASFDIEFVDTNSGARTEVEQLFLSALVSPQRRTVLTVGKFNAPFGIEPRDFWDRMTGSRSLLFDAIPHDLTGMMLTQPVGDSTLTLQPFLVNGFNHDLDVNSQPSFGLVAAWEPSNDLRLAVTNMYGPETAGDTGDKQYMLLVEGEWYITDATTFWAQLLYGTTESPAGSMSWHGAAVIVNHDFNERWRVFFRWSYLDDQDGYVTGDAAARHEVGAGVGWYLHPLIECRFEYRHDFIDLTNDQDSAFAHVTFGF